MIFLGIDDVIEMYAWGMLEGRHDIYCWAIYHFFEVVQPEVIACDT